jgi:hypothetical protein
MQVRVLRNVKLGEEVRLAGSVIEMTVEDAARHPEIFVSLDAEKAAQTREAERAAAEAPKRLLGHMELREQMRADEAERKSAEATILKRNAEYHRDRASEAERQAVVSAGQVDRAVLSVVQAERAASPPAPAAPAPQELPPHKRGRKE